MNSIRELISDEEYENMRRQIVEQLARDGWVVDDEQETVTMGNITLEVDDITAEYFMEVMHRYPEEYGIELAA